MESENAMDQQCIPVDTRRQALEEARISHPDIYDTMTKTLHGLWSPETGPVANPAANPASLLRARNQLLNQYAMWLHHDKSHSSELITQYDALREAQPVLISHDVCSLALDILSTTGIDPEWIDLIPKHVLFACPADVSPLIERLLPVVDDADVPLFDHTFGNSTLGLLSTQTSVENLPIHVLWTYQTSPIGVACFQKTRDSDVANTRSMISQLTNRNLDRPNVYVVPHSYQAAVRVSETGSAEAYVEHLNDIQNTYADHVSNAVDLIAIQFLAAVFALVETSPLIQMKDLDTRTKHEIKRAKKQGRQDDRSYTVTTIHVTDASQPSTTDPRKPIEYHHRWIVSGHFRNQPYGPGGSLRRRQWIPPYIKGPASAPLLNRTKILSIR